MPGYCSANAQAHTHVQHTKTHIHNDGCTFLSFAGSFFLIRHQHNNRHIPFTAMHITATYKVNWLFYRHSHSMLCMAPQPSISHSQCQFIVCSIPLMLYRIRAYAIAILQTHYMFTHANVTHSNSFWHIFHVENLLGKGFNSNMVF